MIQQAGKYVYFYLLWVYWLFNYYYAYIKLVHIMKQISIGQKLFKHLLLHRRFKNDFLKNLAPYCVIYNNRQPSTYLLSLNSIYPKHKYDKDRKNNVNTINLYPYTNKLLYKFTNDNKSPKLQQHSENRNLGSQRLKIQKNQQAQFNDGKQSIKNKQKIRMNEMHQKKIRELQQQQIRQINKKINLTKQNFNPFIAYLKLNRFSLGIILFIISMGLFGLSLSTMIGFYTVQQLKSNDKMKKNQQQGHNDSEIVKKQKLTIISQNYQQKKVSRRIIQLYKNYYETVSQGSTSSALNKKVSIISNRLSLIYGGSYSISILVNQQPIILCLPNRNVMISNSLLRSNVFKEEQLFYLVLLSQQLFNQGYHIRTLGLNQLRTFWDMDSGSSQIKLRQIYSRNYKRREILESIDILDAKLKRAGLLFDINLSKEMFRRLNQTNKLINKVGTKVNPQNIYTRMYKYYIFVKTE